MTLVRKLISAIAAAGLLACLATGPAAAQTPPPEDGPRNGGPPMGGPFGPPGGMSEELQETMHIYLVYRLTEELELTDEQALKLMPLIKRREKIRWAFFQLQTQQQRDLSAMVDDEETSDAAIENMLTTLHEAEQEYRKSEDQLNLEIAALLSTRQYAKFIVFQKQFHNDMAQRVKRLRGMGHQDGRHGGGH